MARNDDDMIAGNDQEPTWQLGRVKGGGMPMLLPELSIQSPQPTPDRNMDVLREHARGTGMHGKQSHCLSDQATMFECLAEESEDSQVLQVARPDSMANMNASQSHLEPGNRSVGQHAGEWKQTCMDMARACCRSVSSSMGSGPSGAGAAAAGVAAGVAAGIAALPVACVPPAGTACSTCFRLCAAGIGHLGSSDLPLESRLGSWLWLAMLSAERERKHNELVEPFKVLWAHQPQQSHPAAGSTRLVAGQSLLKNIGSFNWMPRQGGCAQDLRPSMLHEAERY